MTNNLKPKKFVIIQLARTGDIIQTYAAAKAFQQNHPEVELYLVAREKHYSPVKNIISDVFKRTFTLDKTKIFNTNDQDNIISNVDDFVNVLNAQQFDVVINFSFCKTAYYISTILKTNNKLGNYYNSKHELVCNDSISQYISTFVVNGSLNAFNLTELWASMFGDFSFSSSGPSNSKKSKILIHPFASQERKHWKTGKWVEVIYSLLKNNGELQIEICGNKQEMEFAEAIVSDPLVSKFKTRINSIAGRTSVEELYSKMNTYKLFVGHDSMVSHLAALKGLPSLTVSLGSVRPHETFPMNPGAIVLSPKTACFPCYADQNCNDYVCHTDISHQLVAEIAQQIYAGEMIDLSLLSSKIGHYHASSANIYYADKNESGRFQLITHQETVSTKSLMRDLYNILFSFKLFESTPIIANQKVGAHQANDLMRVKQNIQYLYELAEFGKKYCHYILKELNQASPSIDNINSHSAKIDEIDSMSQSVIKACPELSALVNYYDLQKANSFGSSVVAITESTYLIYNDMSVSCAVLTELIDKIINPVIIKNKNSHQGR